MLPLLTVAIPTHNRARYAIPTIRSILAIPRADLEIVVSDTSTDGELATFMTDKQNIWTNDPRLIYFQPQEKLDMTGNHNSALARAKGEFICLIGDDDTIVEDALVAAAWAKENDIDLIAPGVVANYAWPDFKSRLAGDRHASRLYFAKKMGDEATFMTSEVALARALKNAAQGTDGLPKIYHGLVRRSILEKIREVSGAYFHGSSPDVSGAIALALCSKNFLIVNYPLTIPGASGGSNTGRSAMNTHKGKLDQETQTKGFETSGWSAGVPRFFSVETVWAHAALETIRKIKPEQELAFNFARLIAICHVLHPEFVTEIQSATLECESILNCRSRIFDQQIKKEIRHYRWLRAIRLIKRLSWPTAAGGRSYVSDLSTIEATPAALAKHMARQGMTWDFAVSQLQLKH
jgi:hypothetical protein